MKTDNKYLKLFLTFFKIGACTFGGGYAMISVIQREAAEKNGWVTDDEIIDMLAISESTPGPIAINSATFVGYRVGGVFGSACATFGVVLPSLIIITLIAYFLRQFAEYKVVRYAFNGIRAGVAALVAKAKGLKVVAMTGAGGGKLAALADAAVMVPETETYKIQELHLPIYHALCAALESNLFLG